MPTSQAQPDFVNGAGGNGGKAKGTPAASAACAACNSPRLAFNPAIPTGASTSGKAWRSLTKVVDGLIEGAGVDIFK